MKNSTMNFHFNGLKSIGIYCTFLFFMSHANSQTIQPKCTEVIPEFHSLIEKENWITEHPNSILLEEAKKKEIVYNSFPLYISTGNPTKDEAEYIRLKNEWIANNPEEYKRMLERASIPLSNESKKN